MRKISRSSVLVLILFLVFAAVDSRAFGAGAGAVQQQRKAPASKNSGILKKNLPAEARKDRQKSAGPREKSGPAGAQSGEIVKDKEKLQLLRENKFLEQELSLARNPQYYFVLNLKEKKIELRARGMVLKSWTAGEMRYLGPAVPLEVTALKQKSALNPPKRLLINPAENQKQEESETAKAAGKQEKKQENGKAGEKTADSTSGSGDSFEVPALEITDMPASYELIMSNGLQISIRTKGKEKSRQRREMISWYVLRPVKNLFSGKKEENPRLIVYFDKERDAQGIYWAFIDGLKGIIWLP